MPNTFDWIEFRTDDLPGAMSFYQSLFGWEVTRKEVVEGFEVWLFDTGGEPRLENLRRGGIWLRPPGEPPGVVVYIVVDDIGRTLERVVELGGEVVSGKRALPGGFMAHFKAPDGTLLGLYEDQVAG